MKHCYKEGYMIDDFLSNQAIDNNDDIVNSNNVNGWPSLRNIWNNYEGIFGLVNITIKSCKGLMTRLLTSKIINVIKPPRHLSQRHTFKIVPHIDINPHYHNNPLIMGYFQIILSRLKNSWCQSFRLRSSADGFSSELKEVRMWKAFFFQGRDTLEAIQDVLGIDFIKGAAQHRVDTNISSTFIANICILTDDRELTKALGKFYIWDKFSEGLNEANDKAKPIGLTFPCTSSEFLGLVSIGAVCRIELRLVALINETTVITREFFPIPGVVQPGQSNQIHQFLQWRVDLIKKVNRTYGSDFTSV